MPTPPPTEQGAAPTTWSSSSGGATSSSSSTSPSYSSSSPPDAAASSDSRGGTSSPSPPSCAACRHQRRRCPPDCLLKPYFVGDEPGKFRNALRIFGIKNLQRMLTAVPPPRRDVCVQTVVYESDVRAADPVRGCCGVIQDLESQLMDSAVELEVLRRRLESYRQMSTTSRGSEQQLPNNNPLAIQEPLMARTSDHDVQTKGPDDGVPPPANELAATQQPQPSAMEMEPPLLSQVQPQVSTMPP